MIVGRAKLLKLKKNFSTDKNKTAKWFRLHPNFVFCLLLFVVAVIVLAAHWPSLSAKAFLFDDDQYLLENHLVQNPSFESAKKFVTEVLHPSTVRGYYQPFAMISLMLDVAMGASPDDITVMHITSLCLHVANTLLIAIVIYLLFRSSFASIVVALIYGMHPVTIEPVVWLVRIQLL